MTEIPQGRETREPDGTVSDDRDGQRIRRRTALCCLGTTAVVGLSGCASLLPSGDAAGERTITDVVGRTVDLPEYADRIVCVGGGTLRQIAYMKAADRVVGVENIPEQALDEIPYLLANPGLGELPIVGESGMDRDGNVEQILEVDPDVIFFNGDSSRADELRQRTNTPVVVIGVDSILEESGRELLYDTWETLGQTLRKEDRTAELQRFLGEVVSDLNDRTDDISAAERKSAYAGAFRFGGAHGLSTTRGDTTMFRFSNVDNAIDELEVDQPSVALGHERLLEEDPETIFVDVMSSERVRGEIDENPELGSLTAVEQGRVYTVLPVYRDMRNFGSILSNAYYVGMTLYPDRFVDVDIESRTDDIFETLLNAPLYERINQEFPDVFRPLL
ncbi:ABC-type Fe3+-hydroxamate transport system, periplasmic component [Halalkaliarchaeum sp. AArc-CO]|uniref:ABC transporter substrate-binding protein n=1 Tax=unclassified Halalkaliarchaeum TaxID=2678344 RepID=UPI00217DE48C|nr:MULTISPECIES: ABC transporter substrate-binding protein [unclassified Halalkaliarchaeum]MDR5674495.1 ABC transporter substrate-binding protein [Halalkaliarchaeum sp. AArc-GB]UWG50395.1 ABC-type Fe3+-hydroxamate transport system, periplasmic component [Halalkaliarchaeum sp. AArc-CO]